MNKKTVKQWLALCLTLVLALSPLTVHAAANDAREPDVRFVLEDSLLYEIDLSDQIRDLSTVNGGALCVETGDEWFWAPAEFDPQRPGVVRLGAYNNDEGEFGAEPMWINHFNCTYTLSAEEGNLYDDVASYSFTAKDIYDSLPDDVQIELTYPRVAVGETSGDLVKTLTMSFASYFGAPTLLQTVDRTKEIPLIVSIPGAEAEFRAVPVDFSGDVLTLALYDGDKAGIALHGLNFTFNGVTYDLDDDFAFTFRIPEGLFGCGGNRVSEETEFWYWPSEIEGLPMHSLLNIRIPECLIRRISCLSSCEILQKMIGLPIAVMLIPSLLHTLRKTYAAYGANFRAVLRRTLCDGDWLQILRNLF